MIEIGLDNPYEENVPVKTDYKYLVQAVKKNNKMEKKRVFFGVKYVPEYATIFF